MSLYYFSMKVSFPEEKSASVIYSSITPEILARKMKRSETKLTLKKNIIAVNINASDAVALRASVNSILKKISLSNSLMEVC